MISAAVIDAMIAAGATAEVIAAAWKAELIEDDRAAAAEQVLTEERRERDRLRKRRERDIIAASEGCPNLSKGQIRTDSDKADGPPSPPLTSPQTPLITPPISPHSVVSDETTGAVAPIDPEKLLFDAGIGLLGESGKPERQARPLLGRWRRDHGTEAVIVALGKARREGVSDPVSFIEACLRAKSRAPPAEWVSPC